VELRSERSSPADGSVGAYGFRLAGIGAELLMPAEDDWPLIELRREVGRATAKHESLSEEGARVLLLNGGEVVLERAPARATFVVPFELRDPELVHPYLAPAAAVFGRWHGRESFHAGGFVVGGAAFGVIGGRRAGKSSLLAFLALHGHDIVCDDVLLTDGATAWAGPRAIDLREETATQLGAGVGLGKVGARERWRMTVGPISSRIRVGGWIFPTWAEELSVTRLSARELLPRLAAHRAVRPPSDGRLLLRLAGLPGWELRRPRSWEALAETADRLREALDTAGRASSR
jgi:hypothetical protein